VLFEYGCGSLVLYLWFGGRLMVLVVYFLILYDLMGLK